MSQIKDSDKIETGGSRVKFWGGAVIVLMIILMFMPWNIGNRTHTNGPAVLHGTASGGRQVMSTDTESASRALDTLNELYITIQDPNDPTGGHAMHLLDAIWGPDLFTKMKRNPEAYHLLVEESRKFGLGENPQLLGRLERDQQNSRAPGVFNSGIIMVRDLYPLVGSRLYAVSHNILGANQERAQIFVTQSQNDGYVSRLVPTALPPIQQERIYLALRDLVSVQAAASLASTAVKPSTVMVDQIIAREGQSFTLQVASIDARPLVDAVSVPSDAELQKQLSTYANVPAGQESVSVENPFGFGYQIRNSVKLQMFSISRAEVRAVVQAEKSSYEWEVEARMAYAKDSKQFKNLAATQPTTAPAEAPTTAPAAKLDEVAPFDDIKAGAVRLILDKAVDARVDEISRKIRTTMSLDYQSWATAKSTKAATQPSSLGVNYDSLEYLNKLAATIQAEPRFKVLPTVRSEQNRLLDADELSRDPTISGLVYRFDDNISQTVGLQQSLVPAAAYIITFTRQFMESGLIEKAGSSVLELYKPSDPLLNLSSDGLTFIRLTDAVAAHPANDLESLRAKLVADVKLANAQAKAIEKATAAIDSIKASGKFEVPGAVVATVTAEPARMLKALPPELGLNGPGYIQFYGEVGRKLLGDISGQPLAVVNVPLAQKVFVTQRIALKAVGWASAEELEQNRLVFFDLLGSQMGEPKSAQNPFGLTDKAVANDWVDVSSVIARNQYVSAHKDKSENN